MTMTFEEMCRRAQASTQAQQHPENRFDGKEIADHIKQAMSRKQQDEDDQRITRLIGSAFAAKL